MALDEKTVFTDSKDFTLSTIREMYAEGDIITNPDYQRDYVYDNKRASKLVESLLMGIPIPTVYLCQEQDETYSVIDGQQRITSFVKYLENEYALVGLSELPELNGKYFKELDKSVQKKLKSSSLRAIIILKESQELKYEIFARLNQGSVSLRPQELRNCIYRGSFNEMLEELAKNKYLPLLFHDENNRKSYQERILRFFALRNYTEYKSSINKMMNAYMALHQNADETKIAELKALFTGTIDIIKQVLGADAFLSIDREKNIAIEKFSGSVYDSIIIPFSFFSAHDLMYHADEIRKAVDELKKDDLQYREDTYAATGSRKRVIGRIMAVYNLLQKITGAYGTSDESRNFSSELKSKLFHPGYICSYCNNEILSIDDAEVDHIVPFSQGGKTNISNAQLLHRHCNREKSDSLELLEQDFEDDSE
jgi:5-methylcytosine-specific restriction endonuclease McrA